jgi:CheY-like chemotaxis protein
MEEGDYKILFVDDDDVVLQVAEQLLGDLPYTFMATSSPQKAIQILTLWEIAVLLCDLNMPEVDGIEVLARAREANPDIVSILVTGMADQEATIRAINEGGIWKYIAKPWKPEALVALVKEGVERYSKQRRSHTRLKVLAHNMTAKVKGGKVSVLKGKSPVLTLRKPRFRVRSKDANEVIPDGRYKIEDVIGSGGTGTVYRAQDSLLGMPVAVKVLAPGLAKDQEAIATLKEEARIAMQLSHRHIVRLHNLQMAGAKYFLVMEYVEGQTLRQVLQVYGKLPVDSVVQIVDVCADALSYAHRHGIVHKDLKPENFLLTEDGVLKIIDFGIASLIHTQKTGGPVVGTPAYMSPEQIAGGALDARTDVFSLGVIVYELLTGCLPFRRDVSTGSVQEVSGPANLADLPGGIMEAVARAMAINPDERWKTVDEFSRAFLAAASEAGYDGSAESTEIESPVSEPSGT